MSSAPRVCTVVLLIYVCVCVCVCGGGGGGGAADDLLYSHVLISPIRCRYYGFLLAKLLPPTVLNLADRSLCCLDIAVNFLIAQVTQKAAIKVTQKKELSTYNQESTAVLQKRSSDRMACFNMIVNVYGYVPLVYSSVRMDPVLFKDNVSMLRKEYKRLEVL